MCEAPHGDASQEALLAAGAVPIAHRRGTAERMRACSRDWLPCATPDGVREGALREAMSAAPVGDSGPAPITARPASASRGFKPDQSPS